MHIPSQPVIVAEPKQGLAHKASFVGIVLGVFIIVGLGVVVYTVSLPIPMR